MSLIAAAKHKIGIALDATKNFIFDASAQDGALKLLRESGQVVMTVSAAGEVDFPQMIRSLTGNGYVKLPSGLIIQWGNSVINTSDTTITFPISFANGCFAVIPNCRNVSSFYAVRVGNIANANFVAAQNSATAQSLQWIAVGY